MLARLYSVVLSVKDIKTVALGEWKQRREKLGAIRPFDHTFQLKNTV